MPAPRKEGGDHRHEPGGPERPGGKRGLVRPRAGSIRARVGQRRGRDLEDGEAETKAREPGGPCGEKAEL